MPSGVASCPVVGTDLALTPLLLRTVTTALPRPSLASTVALMFGLAVKACWKIVWPTSFFQSVATCSPTSFMPWLLVVPAGTRASFLPQMASL